MDSDKELLEKAATDLHCTCGAGWEWSPNTGWEMVEAPRSATPPTLDAIRAAAHRTCTEYGHLERVKYHFTEGHLRDFVSRLWRGDK